MSFSHLSDLEFHAVLSLFLSVISFRYLQLLFQVFASLLEAIDFSLHDLVLLLQPSRFFLRHLHSQKSLLQLILFIVIFLDDILNVLVHLLYSAIHGHEI